MNTSEISFLILQSRSTPRHVSFSVWQLHKAARIYLLIVAQPRLTVRMPCTTCVCVCVRVCIWSIATHECTIHRMVCIKIHHQKMQIYAGFVPLCTCGNSIHIFVHFKYSTLIYAASSTVRHSDAKASTTRVCARNTQRFCSKYTK